MSKREAFFVVLNLIDYCTTNLLLSLGGQEVMPVSDYVIQNHGMLGLFVFKLAVTVFVIYGTRIFSMDDRLWGLLNGAFTAVVLWNNAGIILSAFLSTTC